MYFPPKNLGIDKIVGRREGNGKFFMVEVNLPDGIYAYVFSWEL